MGGGKKDMETGRKSVTGAYDPSGRKSRMPAAYPVTMLVDLQVYVVPREKWVLSRRLYRHNIVDDGISLGFVRVLPQLSIHNLRRELQLQLGPDVIPRDFIFIRAVGNIFIQLKPKQEIELKVKNFIPPFSTEPEIYLLEVLPNEDPRMISPLPLLLREDTPPHICHDLCHHSLARKPVQVLTRDAESPQPTTPFPPVSITPSPVHYNRETPFTPSEFKEILETYQNDGSEEATQSRVDIAVRQAGYDYRNEEFESPSPILEKAGSQDLSSNGSTTPNRLSDSREELTERTDNAGESQVQTETESPSSADTVRTAIRVNSEYSSNDTEHYSRGIVQQTLDEISKETENETDAVPTTEIQLDDYTTTKVHSECQEEVDSAKSEDTSVPLSNNNEKESQDDPTILRDLEIISNMENALEEISVTTTETEESSETLESNQEIMHSETVIETIDATEHILNDLDPISPLIEITTESCITEEKTETENQVEESENASEATDIHEQTTAQSKKLVKQDSVEIEDEFVEVKAEKAAITPTLSEEASIPIAPIETENPSNTSETEVNSPQLNCHHTEQPTTVPDPIIINHCEVEPSQNQVKYPSPRKSVPFPHRMTKTTIARQALAREKRRAYVEERIQSYIRSSQQITSTSTHTFKSSKEKLNHNTSGTHYVTRCTVKASEEETLSRNRQRQRYGKLDTLQSLPDIHSLDKYSGNHVPFSFHKEHQPPKTLSAISVIKPPPPYSNPSPVRVAASNISSNQSDMASHVSFHSESAQNSGIYVDSNPDSTSNFWKNVSEQGFYYSFRVRQSGTVQMVDKSVQTAEQPQSYVLDFSRKPDGLYYLKSSKPLNLSSSDMHLPPINRDKVIRDISETVQLRHDAELRRGELIQRANDLQQMVKEKREKINRRHEFWHKKYIEESSMTRPMEGACNSLRSELNTVHRRLIAHLEGRDLPLRLRDGPSKKANYKIMAARLQHEIKELQQKAKAAKLRLESEVKLKEQADREVRDIRNDLAHKKVVMSLARSQIASYPPAHPRAYDSLVY